MRHSFLGKVPHDLNRILFIKYAWWRVNMIFDRFSPKILISLLPAILLLLIISVQPVGSSVPFGNKDVIPITALGSFSADKENVVGTNKIKLLQVMH